MYNIICPFEYVGGNDFAGEGEDSTEEDVVLMSVRCGGNIDVAVDVIVVVEGVCAFAWLSIVLELVDVSSGLLVRIGFIILLLVCTLLHLLKP